MRTRQVLRSRPAAWGALRLATAGLALLAPQGARAALPAASPQHALAVAQVALSPLRVLSPDDAQRYAAGFAAMRRGDFVAGRSLERTVVDPALLGRLEAVRLLHPSYQANYAELSAWLDRNGDLPEAARVYDLALKRRPPHAPAPRAPPPGALPLGARPLGDSDAASKPAETAGRQGPDPAPPRLARGAETRRVEARRQAARAAFYGGDIGQAYALASASGDRWIAGLAALRLKRYPDALANLAVQAADPRQTPWSRSAAAYWAARAAGAVGDAARAQDLLKLAARSPDTFYGLIAGRELDQQAARMPQGNALQAGALGGDPIGAVLAAEAVDPHAVADLARSDARAHRAAALAQIGLTAEAAEDLRLGLAQAPVDQRPVLTSLALALGVPLGRGDVAKAGWARFDLGHFPTPLLQPAGGFIIDKALVYALVLQESQFNADTVSGSGAYGLMQLTAETAARLAGDDALRRDPRALRDPALNLKLGQVYVAKLLAGMKGDIVRAVAAYNCGPGVLQRMTARMGQDVDSLLMVESLPSGQTRDYVQKVMAGYWIYRQIFGQDSRTLDAAASGVRAVAAADR